MALCFGRAFFGKYLYPEIGSYGKITKYRLKVVREKILDLKKTIDIEILVRIDGGI